MNNDGVLAPIDALVGINEINQLTTILESGRLPDRTAHPNSPFWDVNGDSFLTPIDILIVINALNKSIKSPVVRRLDDGQLGYTETESGWMTGEGAGAHQGDFRFHAPGTGTNRASWRFDVSPGAYRVSASWTANPNQASNAPYTILDDGSLLREVEVNQEQPPDDFQEEGVFWEDLGTFHAVGSTLNVELDDGANELVVADAIRVERIADILEWRRSLISASVGGTISLPGGSSVSIPAGALPSDQLVTLLLTSTLPNQPPSGFVESVGPSLSLTFAPPNSGVASAFTETSEGEGTSGNIAFEFNYGFSSVARLPGALPYVDFINSAGEDHLAGVSGTVDVAKQTARVELPADTVQAMIEQQFVDKLAHAIIRVGLTNLAVDNLTETTVPQPLFWDKDKLQFRDLSSVPSGQLPENFTPGGRTLVLVHGILSSAADAFGKCVERIRRLGEYDQVVALDYDSTRGIEHNGTALASFLKDLQLRGIGGVDIEAHSYGTLITSIAVSKFETSDIPIRNLIFLGGPLTGTPMANRVVNLLASVLNVGKTIGGVPADAGGTIEDLLARGMADDIRTGVPQEIFDKIKATRPETTIYVQAGTDPFATDDPLLPDETSFGRKIGRVGQLLRVFQNKVVNGQLYPGEQNDALVPRWSAELRERNVNRLVRLPPLPLSHVQLECNAESIENVFREVNAPQPAIIVTATPNPTTTEGGGSTTFTITLNRDPSSPVTVHLRSTDGSEGLANPLSIVLTSGNDPAIITVTGQDDDLLDGNQQYTIAIDPTISDDFRFNNIDPNDVQVINIDNELPPAAVTVEVLDSITSEDGDHARFRVRLDTQPTAEVSIWMTPTDNDRGQKEGLLDEINIRFSVDNWDQFQEVTVIGQNDNDDDDDVPYQILGVALSDDPSYDLLHIPDVDLVNLDNDDESGGGSGNLLLDYSVSASGQTVNGRLSFEQICGSAGNAPPGGYHLTDDSGDLVTNLNDTIQTVSIGSPHTVIFTTQGAIGTNGSGQFNFVVNSGQVGGAAGIGFIRATVNGTVYQGSITGGTYTPMSTFVECPFLQAAAENLMSREISAQLTPESLDSIGAAAIGLWIAAGLSDQASLLTGRLSFQIADLAGTTLGMATPQAILIDRDAAGYGWFIDATPEEPDEFVLVNGRLTANHGPSSDRFDLLTVLTHEIGHLLGLDDLDTNDDLDDVMSAVLNVGERRFPSSEAVDSVFLDPDSAF